MRPRERGGRAPEERLQDEHRAGCYGRSLPSPRAAARATAVGNPRRCRARARCSPSARRRRRRGVTDDPWSGASPAGRVVPGDFGGDSMASSPSDAGRGVPDAGLSRELSPVRDLLAAIRARPADPARAPADRAHAHGEGRRRRPYGRCSPGRRACSSCMLFPASATGATSRGRLLLFRLTEALEYGAIGRSSSRSSSQVRDERVRLRCAPRPPKRRRPKLFLWPLLAWHVRPGGSAPRSRPRLGIGDWRFVVGCDRRIDGLSGLPASCAT